MGVTQDFHPFYGAHDCDRTACNERAEWIVVRILTGEDAQQEKTARSVTHLCVEHKRKAEQNL